MWDCVDKLAKQAYEGGLDVLVDEDLTEFMFHRVFDKELKKEKYDPTYIFNKSMMKEIYLETRQKRPWFWQNY